MSNASLSRRDRRGRAHAAKLPLRLCPARQRAARRRRVRRTPPISGWSYRHRRTRGPQLFEGHCAVCWGTGVAWPRGEDLTVPPDWSGEPTGPCETCHGTGLLPPDPEPHDVGADVDHPLGPNDQRDHTSS
jgi:hypothetical protein